MRESRKNQLATDLHDVINYVNEMRWFDWQLLEELCLKNNWPMPQYQLHTAVHHDIANNTAIDVQLFIFKARSHPYLSRQLAF